MSSMRYILFSILGMWIIWGAPSTSSYTPELRWTNLAYYFRVIWYEIYILISSTDFLTDNEILRNALKPHDTSYYLISSTTLHKFQNANQIIFCFSMLAGRRRRLMSRIIKLSPCNFLYTLSFFHREGKRRVWKWESDVKLGFSEIGHARVGKS